MTALLNSPSRIAQSPKPPNRDRHLQNAAETALQQSGYHSVGKLDCEVVDGTVVLSGRVTSYYQKQIAQTVVMKLDAVKEVENRLQVKSRH